MAGNHGTQIPQLCNPCAEALPWYQTPHCPQCALPNRLGETCGRCLQHPPAFNQTLTVFRYAYPLDHLLHRFKYEQALACGQVLIDSMCAQWPHPPLGADIMMAMPMHPLRLKARGFNHAHMLAKALAQQWQIQLDETGIARVKDSAPQAALDMQARIRSLKGAFTSSRNWQGAHVMIVDDVMTTGASMHALAKVLKQSGASKITAVLLARTLKND